MITKTRLIWQLLLFAIAGAILSFILTGSLVGIGIAILISPLMLISFRRQMKVYRDAERTPDKPQHSDSKPAQR